MERNGRDSTKCYGSKAPPESCYVNFKNMIIPNGPAAPTNSGSYMGHNEYIVYNMNQARIRYIIEMDMNGGWMILFLISIKDNLFINQGPAEGLNEEA